MVAAGITHGPVFRRLHRGDTVGRSRLSAASVALVVKDLAGKVGLDPGRCAGHSLRRGFLTSAARNRASIFKMADQSRHNSLDVLREYVSNEERFEDHAAEGMLQQTPAERRASSDYGLMSPRYGELYVLLATLARKGPYWGPITVIEDSSQH
jgi:hypothetical protein